MSGKGGYITGQVAHAAPTWDDVVTYSTEGQAAGYAMGWAHGWREGYRAAQRDAQAARDNANVSRAVIDHIDVWEARKRAAQRAGEPPARGWAS